MKFVAKKLFELVEGAFFLIGFIVVLLLEWFGQDPEDWPRLNNFFNSVSHKFSEIHNKLS